MQQRLVKLWSSPGTPLFQELLTERVRRFADIIGDPTLTETSLRSDDKCARAFEQWASAERHQELRDMLQRIEAMNEQQVASIAFDRNDVNELYDVVHGIVSGFNSDDINYYIHTYKRGADDPLRRNREARILEILGIEQRITLGWIASTPTLTRILEQLDKMPGCDRGELGDNVDVPPRRR